MSGSPEDGFLGRWSRLKQAGGEAAPAAEIDESLQHAPIARMPAQDGAAAGGAAAAGGPAADGEAPEERAEEEVLAALGLKAPEDLEPGDDIRGFMQAAAPDHLRRRALRRLWRLNPALANLDGLVDYGEDFTDSATVIENLQTIYRVGKGMLPDPEPETAPDAEQENAAEQENDAEDAAAADAAAPPPEAGAAKDLAAGAGDAGDASDAGAPPTDPEIPAPASASASTGDSHIPPPRHAAASPAVDELPVAAAPARRRMAFDYAENEPAPKS